MCFYTIILQYYVDFDRTTNYVRDVSDRLLYINRATIGVDKRSVRYNIRLHDSDHRRFSVAYVIGQMVNNV